VAKLDELFFGMLLYLRGNGFLYWRIPGGSLAVCRGSLAVIIVIVMIIIYHDKYLLHTL
jgi:hypothetical protein